jgi:hypothetical protein
MHFKNKRFSNKFDELINPSKFQGKYFAEISFFWIETGVAWLLLIFYYITKKDKASIYKRRTKEKRIKVKYRGLICH